MDSTLTLALMMKAKLIFEQAPNFLSFPLTPLSYTNDQIAFLLDAELTPQDLSNLSAFSSLVNTIPDGPTWPPASLKYLDDAYGDILRNADLATSTRTPDEEKQYDDALAVLYTVDENGLRTPSAQVTAYQQYRDLAIVAQQNYANAKSTADASSDPAVQAQWSAQQPALLQAIAGAMNDWIEKGYKTQIEEARGVEQRLGAKSPETQWAAWTTQFDPHLTGMTDALGETFYPSVPSPANVFEAGVVWQRFTMLGDEADALVRGAPADLQARFAGAQSVGIRSVAFDYASLLVKRPWFDPSIFAQRFWRFADPAHVVSDGASLKNGTCPAYVQAAVFIRNVQVELAAPLAPGKGVDVGFFHLQAARAGTLSPLLMTSVRPEPAPGAAVPVHMMAASATATPVATAPSRAATLTLAQARLFNRVLVPPAPANPAPAAPAAPALDTSIYVLGFICAPVAQSPNPDPALTWS